jgi:hypothetical protein
MCSRSRTSEYSFDPVCPVYSMSIDNIFDVDKEVWLLFIMECDLFNKDLKGLFPFYSMQVPLHKRHVSVEYVRICLLLI